jgi:hypothetical protein
MAWTIQKRTFNEILEFYLPGTSEKERQSIRKFELGLSADDGNKPAGYQWNSENVQELFVHWNKVSGPGGLDPIIRLDFLLISNGSKNFILIIPIIISQNEQITMWN